MESVLVNIFGKSSFEESQKEQLENLESSVEELKKQNSLMEKEISSFITLIDDQKRKTQLMEEKNKSLIEINRRYKDILKGVCKNQEIFFKVFKENRINFSYGFFDMDSELQYLRSLDSSFKLKA